MLVGTIGKLLVIPSSTGGEARGSHFAARVCSRRWVASDCAASEQADHSACRVAIMYPVITPPSDITVMAMAMRTSASVNARCDRTRTRFGASVLHWLEVLIFIRNLIRSQPKFSSQLAGFNLRVNLAAELWLDRKSTRLNSSHGYISYAVFCLKKKNN